MSNLFPDAALAGLAPTEPALLEQLPCAVLVTDRHGHVAYSNPAAQALLPLPRSGTAAFRLDGLLTVPSRVFLQTHVWPTLLRDGTIAESYLEVQTGQDAGLPVLIHGRQGVHDGKTAFVWVLLPAQQRSRFEAELLRARQRAEDAWVRLAQSQAALRRTGELAAVGGWELDLERGRHAVELSEALRTLLGLPLTRTLTKAEVLQHVAPGDRLRLLRATVRCAGGAAALDMVVTFLALADRPVRIRLVALLEPTPQGAAKLVGAAQDVTEREGLVQALAEQHELMRVTLHAIGDAVITTDAEGRIVWLNPVAARMTGWTANEASGQPLEQVFRIVHQLTRQTAPNPVQACLAQRRVVNLADETVLLARDGAEYGIEDSAAPMFNAKGDLVGAVMVFHDVTARRQMTTEMGFRASHDALTGLINRTEFEVRVNHAMARVRAEGSQHAVMAIDLDRFKVVNDTCGHAAGDLLLKQVARLMQECLRARDTLARLGGDEFGVLLEHCTVAQAERVGRQICGRLDDFRFIHEGKRFRIGASIGLAPIDQRWVNADDLMQAADSACYAAKEEGRNRVHVWVETNQALHQRQGQVQWASALEQALDEDRFVLFGQAIARIVPGAPAATSAGPPHTEVLLRLRAPDGELVSPGVFMPAAERFHLASRIDRWVLRAVLRRLRQWGPQHAGVLSVNLSGQSVADRLFHRDVLAELTSLDAELRRCLWFEITETVAVAHMADASAFITDVRRLGIKVALDDFGAGASSFGYLRSLAVDVLKIDGQYITDLTTNRLSEAAVRCFVEVAQVAGLETVAEFVDNAASLQRAVELGVTHAQGYLLHRPSPLDDFVNERALAGTTQPPLPR